MKSTGDQVPDPNSGGPSARQVSGAPARYHTAWLDSGRLLDFPYRPGDIVISTRPKSGTTWIQMICALLVFQTPDLPAPLSTLSPWLDSVLTPYDQVCAQLAAQRHRRFIKTHTPLDGMPLDEQVTYIVVARHPLDAALSLYHQHDNIDLGRRQQRPSRPEPSGSPVTPAAEHAAEAAVALAERPSARDWLLSWIERDADPCEVPESLPGVMRHLSDAWHRRGRPNVVLVHYDDLSGDLEGQMRGLAARLGITVPGGAWPGLVRAATFEHMRANADLLAPNLSGELKDNRAFFRQGRSGAGHELLSAEDLARYRARTATLAAPDLLAWLHRGR